MKSSFEEGRSAGFLEIGRGRNPYRKPEPLMSELRLQLPDIDQLASDWDSGYVDGEALGRGMVLDKRKDSCR
jgi:hypothetical protein